MKNALILHGTDNNSQGNWFPWLKRELESIDYEVWVPNLPQSDKPDLEKYWNHIKDFNFNEETILVGHSSGAVMVFGILNKLPKDKKVKLAISVSGFIQDEGWNCEGLFSEKYNWEKIRNQAEEIKLIWSPSDSYISEEQTGKLAENLKVEPTIFKNMGHFNLEQTEEFKKFPELLKIIISNEYNRCPICGYSGLQYKAKDPRLYSSYDICPCCGIEFGYEIMEYNKEKIEELRKRWLENGAKFFSNELRPANWSKENALKQISRIQVTD